MLDAFMLTSVLFAVLALLLAVQSALTDMGFAPPSLGLPWLRVHLVTLGVLVELFFGFLPTIVATRLGQPRPALHWPLWLMLNTGLLILLIGIPVVSSSLIATGGALVFAATALLIRQIQQLRSSPGQERGGDYLSHVGTRFYVTGAGFLLVGITVGTGLWLGWSVPLRIAVPREAHIHANAFGFMALVLAGLLLDVSPSIRKRSVIPSSAIGVIYWGMSLGALGLVIGPWLDIRPMLLVGVLLHLVATVTLLATVVAPLVRERETWNPGLGHIMSAYIWFLLPIIAAPLIVLNVLGLPEGRVEQRAPQALTFGWMLQFGFALAPYALRRLLLPAAPPKLGGSWLGLVLVNLGCVLMWSSIAIEPYDAPLQAAAYACWALSLLPFLADAWKIAQASVDTIESDLTATVDL